MCFLIGCQVSGQCDDKQGSESVLKKTSKKRAPCRIGPNLPPLKQAIFFALNPENNSVDITKSLLNALSEIFI